MTVQLERLTILDTLTLQAGSHSSFEQGHCAMEVVSWLAGEGFTDAPACASPVLRRYMITLNDRWGEEQRQKLIPYLPRMVGTGGDGKDALREQVAAQFLATRLLAPWLELADMGDHMASLDGKTGAELRTALYRIRDAAWAKRSASRELLRKKIREHLAKKHPAVAVAVADAVAAAVAAAAAAAAAAADAAAAAAADADAAAVADDAAAAVAAAAAAAAAVAVADAAAAAAADKNPWETSYSAAYEAARKYYRDNPLPVMAKIEDLAAKQAPLALELLELLIDPQVA